MADGIPNGTRFGSDWGIASLVMGAVFALMAVPTFSLAHAIEVSHWTAFSPDEHRLAVSGGFVGIGVVLLLCVTAAGFGIAGMVTGRRCGGSIALGLAGLLLSALDLMLWGLILLAWLGQQPLHRF
jgi:hypothetical protein